MAMYKLANRHANKQTPELTKTMPISIESNGTCKTKQIS